MLMNEFILQDIMPGEPRFYGCPNAPGPCYCTGACRIPPERRGGKPLPPSLERTFSVPTADFFKPAPEPITLDLSLRAENV
jgi:hypothetical protein